MPKSEALLLIIAMLLACWRLSVMLVEEAGPFELFERLRYAGRNTMLGSLLECVWCTSVWVSALILLAAQFVAAHWLIYWLALSAGAILLQVATERIRR